jgi:hypothetical protein
MEVFHETVSICNKKHLMLGIAATTVLNIETAIEHAQ